MSICGSSRNCGRIHHQRQHETFDSHAFKSNRRKECVRMPRKTARSGPQTPLGRSGMLGAIHPLASGLPAGSETPTIHVSSGFIWGIPVYMTAPEAKRSDGSGFARIWIPLLEFGSLNANSWRYHWQGRPTHMGRPSSWVARTIGEPRWQLQPQPPP